MVSGTSYSSQHYLLAPTLFCPRRYIAWETTAGGMLRSGISSSIPAIVAKIEEQHQSGSFSPCRGETPHALAAWSSVESTHQSSAVSGSFGREISHSDLWTKASGACIHRLSLSMKHFWWISSLRLTVWKLSQNFAQLGFVYTWEAERKGRGERGKGTW